MNGHSRRETELVRRLLKRDPSAGRMLAAKQDLVALLRAIADEVDGYLPAFSAEENEGVAKSLRHLGIAVETSAGKSEIDVVSHKHCVRCIRPTEDTLNEAGVCDICEPPEVEAALCTRCNEMAPVGLMIAGVCEECQAKPKACECCDGTGKVVILGARHAHGLVDRPSKEITCPTCGGNGVAS